MAYIVQQHPQQISTENLACQKRKSVADNAVGCKAFSFSSLFCIPLNGFNKINGGICFRHHDHNTGRCDRSSNNVWRVQAVPRYVSYASVVRSPLPPSHQTETQNDNQSKIQQESGKTIDYILNLKKGRT